MRRQDWAVLAFKLIGAGFTAYGLIALSGLAAYLAPNPTGVELPAWMALIGLLPAWITLGVGAAFWMGAPSFAARVFSDVPPPDFAEPIDVNAVLQLVLALLGTYFVLDAIPLLVQGVGLYVYSRRMGALALGVDYERQSMVFGATAQTSLIAAAAREVLGWVIIANRARLAAKLKPTRVVNPFAEDEPAETPQP